MNKTEQRNIIINSSLLFVVASIIEMTFHETGHYIAAMLTGAKEISLHHNYVMSNSDDLSLTAKIFEKAAGPLVSLFIGILFHIFCMKQTKRNLLFLFKLYMAVFGYIGVLGYLLISPFFTSGDTGYICYVLNFPLWLTSLIALTGGIIAFLLMRNLMKYFVEMGTAEIATNINLRQTFIPTLILYPLFIGIAVTTLLNLPVLTPLSLIAPLTSPFTIMWAYGYALKQKYPTTMMNKDLSSISRIDYKWIIIFVLIVVFNRILVCGI
jgi:hypothetical protein